MKFLQSIAILGLAIGAHAACTIDGTDPNCCWGGDQGNDACSRQNGYIGCINGYEDNNFCRNMGIPNSKCDADCCDTRTGWGKPCPKGKNRCDPDSGCPF
ncbi:hypothetical protein CPLU01_12612 [Colletotrichum plurivorum]|uniref:Biotrophy-associated secreted protein 3 n=1 Tax=Colletotrichum plurivorum TaxID=2175906 RepID=A0A8H6N662_9PEZI|nr:hypothetical protein CPLU01_12612 [Colletotrichum plurivorum]